MSITYIAQPFDLAMLADVQDATANTGPTGANILQRLLSASSQYILSKINRPIFNRFYTELYDGNGSDLLVLNNYPINSVTLVQSNSPNALSGSISLQPQIIPASADGSVPGYVFDDTALYLVGGYTFPLGRKNIRVSYSAGYGLAATKTYDSANTYAIGDTALASDFNVYVSLMANNTGNDPLTANSTFWSLLCPMLPMDLSQAAIELTNFKYRRTPDIAKESGNIGGESISFSKLDVPREVSQVILQYNRRFTI